MRAGRFRRFLVQSVLPEVTARRDLRTLRTLLSLLVRSRGEIVPARRRTGAESGGRYGPENTEKSARSVLTACAAVVSSQGALRGLVGKASSARVSNTRPGSAQRGCGASVLPSGA